MNPVSPSTLSFFILLLAFRPTHSRTCSTFDLFTAWCHRHGKTYSSDHEKLHRFRVFESNLNFINQHSLKGNSSYALALNSFADLTHDEFRASKLGLLVGEIGDVGFDRRPDSNDGDGLGDVPASVDWRKSGAVTYVKDQKSCGACWAFTATGAMEGINQIVTGSLVSLSEQELIDCDRRYNSGCEGGLMDYAYQFVVDNHGIDTEEDYPYLARDRTCNKDKLKHVAVTIDGYADIPPRDEKQLLKGVAKQPVSVGISGSDRAVQFYSKGILTPPCSTSLDHAVLIVGYGSENGMDYWIVKNSWGTDWGMKGYMHIQRNSGQPEGVCGINLLASYPVKTSPNPPPPPSPHPTKCDLFTSCGAGETCCCSWRLLGICFSWKCCELNAAVCCKDGQHCCPHDYPICNTRRNQCLKKSGNYTLIKKLKKSPGDEFNSFLWDL
uniref:Uncharacterized protein n=1 Tax=Kalanchoe fedtschenkoi TaxID=63787 RepID=A0A7N0R9N8_KALFE